MRIRKHARISQLLNPISANHSSDQAPLKATPYICQLNQSPWDVMTFSPSPDSSPPPQLPPPPPLQAEENDSFTNNGTLEESIGAFASLCVVASVKLEEEEKKDALKNINDGATIMKKREKEDQLDLQRDEDSFSISSSKTGERAWHCNKDSKEGHTKCQHHLDLQSHNKNLGQPVTKKSNKSPPFQKRRPPRAKKPLSCTNANEFYYYSGFGPLWGKKRGPNRAAPNRTAVAAATTFCNDKTLPDESAIVDQAMVQAASIASSSTEDEAYLVNKPVGRFNALLCVGQFFPDSPDRLDEFTNFNKGQS
ncbi:hypothetical protein RJ639_037989 [Escallonia herrerae]|uniref:Uncharacterized protein n=1 Tax=Escallonia herrerae TaxID=1293975 RepID=A0AA89B711_9ASTE|nr:hypothetical protein RJ639_037989 [Escallonia herrerae]